MKKLILKDGRLDHDPICPNCKAVLSGFTSIDHEDQPTPGDVTICFKCSRILQFDDDLNFVDASDDAVRTIAESPLHTKMITEIRKRMLEGK